MDALFLQIVNMSITASYLVIAVILLRIILKKAPKWIFGILWGFVGLRLIFPISFNSVLSIIPSGKTLPSDIIYSKEPAIDSGISYINERINPIISNSLTPNLSDSATPIQIIAFICSVIWIIGISVMLIYTLISYIIVKQKVKESIKLYDNIYLNDKIATPFILGIIKPKIYLPFNMENGDREFVIAHENAHLKRRDHLWKPLGFLLLSVYWFNPLLWVGYILLCRDIELATDQKVIKQMGSEIKKSYSEVLINCSVPRKMITACPLAFGEVGVKQRIKGVLNYKKPAFWLIIVSAILVSISAVCLLTNPAGTKLKNIEFGFNMNYKDYVGIAKEDNNYFIQINEFDNQTIKKLLNLRISRNEVSKKRGEDRDKSHTLILQTKGEMRENPSIYSFVAGTRLHFNEDFTEVWLEDSVKPTLSYRILNPNKAQELYFSLGGKGEIGYGLKSFLDEVIIKENGREDSTDTFEAFDYEILDIKHNIRKTILYLWICHSEYTFNNGKLTEESGLSIPTAITVEYNVDKNGYELIEYWIPRDGTYYPKDIKAKFTPYARWQLYNQNNFTKELINNVKNKAEQHFKSIVYKAKSHDTATLTLNPYNSTCTFSYSLLSSYYAVGTYTDNGEYITLKTDDGKNTYTFERNKEDLIFISEMSSAMPKYKYSADSDPEICLSNGAIFTKQ